MACSTPLLPRSGPAPLSLLASKHEIVEDLFDTKVLEVITDEAEFGATQAPDLLIYKSDLLDWFLCEVKGPNDSLGEMQSPKRACSPIEARL